MFFVLLASILVWYGHPIYQILSLIFASLGLGYNLYLTGAEFIAVLVVLVYVGAVTVLFLFVVMMINFRAEPELIENSETFLFWIMTGVYLFGIDLNRHELQFVFNPVDLTNFFSFGGLLYNSDWNYTVVVTSLILLVGMISSICLTYVSSENYRSQHIWVQINTSNAVFVYR